MEKSNVYQRMVNETIRGLKDFQKATVNYVYKRIYEEGQARMLVADEVGLGKTIVAKGIIAKAYENRVLKGHADEFNVVYICSNQALAAQNLTKLNFTREDHCLKANIERLTYLAYKPEKTTTDFHIHSLTPMTSFKERSSLGKWDERYILFLLLTNNAEFQPERRKEVLSRLLQGKIGDRKWAEAIRDSSENRKRIHEDLFDRYRQRLQNFQVKKEEFIPSESIVTRADQMSLWEVLILLCNSECDPDAVRRGLIRMLKRILLEECLRYLNADLFILDEFQRYNDLIKKEKGDNTVSLAREIFKMEQAKVLMLSATPFKPYTNDFDELNGEVHYSEFKTVLEFLYAGTGGEFPEDYEKQRAQFYSRMLRLKDGIQEIEEIGPLKENIEKVYRKVMVRTEKIMSSRDVNAMVKEMLPGPLSVESSDIKDFVALDKIVQYVNDKSNGRHIPVPLAYAKSAPFALSFLRNYQIQRKVKYLRLQTKLRNNLRNNKSAWLDFGKIRNYAPLGKKKGIPNAKLRFLLEGSIQQGASLLWIPAALNYYDLDGIYKDAGKFTKTLLFSSWMMVPKMISALVSYEAERLTIGRFGQNKIPYFVSGRENRHPLPLLTFKVKEGTQKEVQEVLSMTSFILLYPCVTLAEMYDPVENLREKRSLNELKSHVKTLLKKKHICLQKNGSYRNGQAMSWIFPLELDKQNEKKAGIIEGLSQVENDQEEPEGKRRKNQEAKKRHVRYTRNFLNSEEAVTFKLDKNQYDRLLDEMALLVLGSPAICAYRALKRHWPEADCTELFSASYRVASAFVTLFNKPESIAILRIPKKYRKEPYWKAVLNYCVDGGLQAMLDEYVYMLKDSGGLDGMSEIVARICDVLKTRTSGVQVDDADSFVSDDKRKNGKLMRVHYALDFGQQKLETAGGTRQINIREAFNSPFRPFVLSTTSIGQEGLDFHFYCRRVIHWNLPANPIDFEQREGRINRYKSHVIRQKLAHKYVGILTECKIPWEELFRLTGEEKKHAKTVCDLVPFWHLDTEDDIFIERYVPLFPFSEDIRKYSDLKKILGLYRLTFGQPRQEELAEALENKKLSPEQLDQLLIKLCPLLF